MHSMSRVSSLSFSLLLISSFLYGIVFFIPSITHAQTTLEPGTGANIVLEPAFPEPNTTVTASLDAYTLDTTGATITWYADGVAQPQFQNARNITLNVGSIGEKLLIRVTVQPQNAPAFTLRKEIMPISVDIITEARTYVPSFYRGRALPSADSNVRVIAIPHTMDGTAPKNLTYRWEQNGSVLFGGAIYGKQSAELTVSRYYGGYVSVTIIDAEGKSIARKNITLDATSPELHFYEENPLRGLSERALTESFTLIGDETTVHGEAFFLNTDIGRTITTYDWTINSAPAENGNPDPHIITLRKTGGSGSATIGLQAVRDTGIPEFVTGSFVINF